MKRRLVIHAGMNKTGSSSIQASLTGLPDRDPCYLLRGHQVNHSWLFGLLFHDPVEEFYAFRRRAIPRRRLEKLRNIWSRRFETELETAEASVLIFSSEDLSGPYEQATAAFADCVRKFVTELHVVAYVRPPVSFMESQFVQSLKSGHWHGNLNRLWPGYRARFEKLDRIFGAENVELRPFRSADLQGGDVVVDFCRKLEIDIGAEQLVHRNEGLSLEASALLYLQLVHGSGLGRASPDAMRRNRRLTECLSSVGKMRLSFADDMVQPVLKRYSDDLCWMEDRLGCSLRENSTKEQGLKRIEELEQIALDNRRLLIPLLSPTGDLGDHGSGRRAVITMMNKLREQV